MSKAKNGQEGDSVLSRREFFRRLALTSAALGLGGSSLFSGDKAIGQASDVPSSTSASAPAEAKSRVVLVRHAQVLGDDNSINGEILQQMVDKALCVLTDKQERGEAWAQLFKAEDVVSLKVNTIAGPTCSTRPEVAQAMTVGMAEAGIAPENIIIWDRTEGELVRAGYKINFDGSGVRVFSSERVGYGDEIATDAEGRWRTQFSRIITDHSTALINVPILKTHGETGLTAALKNHMGSHNRTGAWHSDFSAIAYLSAAEPVLSRSRLCLCDALRPLYNAGPSDAPRFRWNFCGIVASTDPVAHDVVCAKIIEDKRKEVRGEAWPISPEPTYLEKAGDLGLGNLDWEKIEFLEFDLAA